MSAPQELQPLTFPLSGVRLVEASAGTGKTYTIALLYVRLVLGHGVVEGGRGALNPPEILVVTFTRAATSELRERIRARLGEAAACFEDETPIQGGWDPLLVVLRADYPPATWAGCARRLRLAAEWMDEAAVETIHGWCHRMLREHAFDSDSLFTQELVADQRALLAEVTRDYWRVHLAPLSLVEARELFDCWPDYNRLARGVERLFRQVGLLEDPGPFAAILDERSAIRAELGAVKRRFGTWIGPMRAMLDEAVAGKRVNGLKIQARYYGPWLEALGRWCADPEELFPALTEAAWWRLTPGGLNEAWKVGSPPDHPAWEAIVELRATQARWEGVCRRLWVHAAIWVAARFAAAKQGLAVMEFDDVLTRLESGLNGAGGARLAGLIRRQFPVALIDEFQDTDPVQYRIFAAIYRDLDGCRDGTALVLIGDPKQAIYAFRGADIHTYLSARRVLTGRIHTLGRNFRSSAAMVAAVNRVFADAEARVGAGAFLHRRGEEDPIPFHPVVAQGREARFEVEETPQPAMTLAVSDGPRPWLADACASAMVRLLELGRSNRAGFRDGVGALVPLLPSDMAVLVRSRAEYGLMRAALARRGVRCVYLSDQESVFASPCAVELRHWLAACAAPEDSRLLRTAMATATLGVSWLEIDALARDERLLEQRMRQFAGFKSCWRRQGVLPMLRRMMHEFGVPARLLHGSLEGERSGERLLTDLLHLAELLGRWEADGEGELAVIRLLDEALREAGEGAREAGERLTRLESDANLVRIVTVHKSKGLEYPLVFLPFAGSCRPLGKGDLPARLHDDEGVESLLMTADETLLARLDFERLREETRQLYVALTRARHAVWVGVGVEKGFEKSALSRLLGVAAEKGWTAETLMSHLARFEEGDGAIRILPTPEPTTQRFGADQDGAAVGPARQARRRVRDGWWMASYSALLASSAGGGVESLESAGEARFRELALERDQRARAPSEGMSPEPGMTGLHPFPRGARAGTVLHELLAWCGGRGFGAAGADAEGVRAEVARRLNPRGWSAWIDPLSAWLTRFLATPLPLDGLGSEVSLSDLETWQVELEFWLAVERLPVAGLDRWLRATIEPGCERPTLADRTLQGMLKGFMDLVFEHGGRYYLIDYKSTWLGPDDAACTPEAMRAAILHARHDLQGVLYLYALHRLLSVRLVDYDPARHLGGALFLFLRGLDTPARGIWRLEATPAMLAVLDGWFGQTPEG
ncbi:RecBCD enzyme subunit RecB [Candidatus Magnetaquicoccaceae bacterium FCR-1]|uniref:RecBCD enzyme subunit RecB n=1 Tax=Candidatus Magnetaquiglobus chichijimensis TaxID=3141448 RepID=A0ABQ0CB87_9PROT